MKLLISIEYRTRWGEQLVMRTGKRRIALQYADGGVWTGAIERYTQSEDTEYRYEIERDGACIRSEWRPTVTAACRRSTSPASGSGVGRSLRQTASGPPKSSITIAYIILSHYPSYSRHRSCPLCRYG